MINKDYPLIFMHIPKTGGMSMFASLVEHYGLQIADMYNMSAYDEDRGPLAEVLSDPDLCVYTGHFPFGLHEWLSRPSCCVSIIRKPLDRIISLYHYIHPFRAHIRQVRKETGKSLQELFDMPGFADFYRDFVPWIEGDPTPTAFFQCRSPELDNGMVRRFSGIGLTDGPCPDTALQQAKENIENCFSLVGVLERYPETVRLARMTLRINFTEFHVNRQTRQQKQGAKLSIALKRRIKEMNWMDLELYDWVLARFEQIIAAPAAAIALPAGGRTDYERVKLWHAIGTSPVRTAIMQHSPANPR